MLRYMRASPNKDLSCFGILIGSIMTREPIIGVRCETRLANDFAQSGKPELTIRLPGATCLYCFRLLETS